jgi:hypothetical protein
MPLNPIDPVKLQGILEHEGARWRAGQTSVSGLTEAQKLRRLGANTVLARARQGASAQRHARTATAG